MPDIEKSTKVKKDDEESLKQELSEIIENFLKTEDEDKCSTDIVKINNDLKRYNIVAVGITAAFKYYIRDEAFIKSKYTFRDLISALKVISDVISIASKINMSDENINKWKQKGQEYFDHIHTRVSNCDIETDKIEQIEKTLHLTRNDFKSVAEDKSIETYSKYADIVGYNEKNKKDVLDFLEKLKTVDINRDEVDINRDEVDINRDEGRIKRFIKNLRKRK